MKLFRVTVYGGYSTALKGKTKCFYVIKEDKIGAKDYLSRHLKDGIIIRSISYLGDEISGILFSK